MDSKTSRNRRDAAAVAVTPFQIERRLLDDSCLQLRIGGELDLTTADRLIEAIEEAMASETNVVLDLQPCSFLDSTGIATILTGRRELADRGRVLCVVGARDAVERVFEITGLTASDLVKADIDAALLACGAVETV
jgi:anti-anti-sigma factor